MAASTEYKIIYVRNIPEDLWKAVKVAAIQRGISLTQAVAEALGRWLENR